MTKWASLILFFVVLERCIYLQRSFRLTLDAEGREWKLNNPDGSEVHRSYTARGELHQISQRIAGGSLTVIDTRVYDDAGRMISSSYDNGVSQVHSYNTDNTLAGIAFSGAAIGDLAYTWDVNHNKVSETIDGVMSGYGFTATYDAEDRLITYDRSNGNLDQVWDLTAVGDMSNVTTNTTVQARTHGPAHELLTAGGAPISTDARGNISAIPAALRSNGVKVYLNYDFDNRFNSLTANIPLSQPGALFQNYSYDALGRRVGFQGNNGQTIFICCGQQVLCDYGVTAPPSNPNMSYIYGDYVDEPIMRSIGGGGTRLYYHRNQQYSIIALTDSSGAIQERYAYSAYGELTIANASGTTLSTSAVNNRYTYTGREWDSTIGLFYFRARMYDARLSRFCSRDPIEYVDGASLYGNYFVPSGTDPSGKSYIDYWIKLAGGHLYKAIGLQSGGILQLESWGVPIPAKLSASAGVYFFPDSCEIGIYSIKSGYTKLLDPKGGPLKINFEGGFQAGITTELEGAGFSGPGTADAASFSGIFYTVEGGVAWVAPGVGVSGYMGEPNPITGAFWSGGTVSATLGAGIPVGPTGVTVSGGSVAYNYQLLSTIKLNQCICLALILAM